MLRPANKDFLFSTVLIALGVYVIYEGYAIYQRAAAPPFKIVAMSVSPGLLPIILGIALILLSTLLLSKSLASREGSAFGEQLSTLAAWFPTLISNRDFISMSAGVAIMALYVFGLVKNLPYWASSFLFLAGMFFFLRVGKWWKVIAIAATSVGGVMLLFQVIFQAALP